MSENIISGTITNVVVIKIGTSPRGIPWKLFEVEINGEKYRTFDEGYSKLINQQGEWVYDEEERTSMGGKLYTSKTLKSLPKEEEIKKEIPVFEKFISRDEFINGLGIIRGDLKSMRENMELKLEHINNLLQAVSIKISGEVPEEKPKMKKLRPDIKDEDIPVIK